jgi:hypothetical protein
MLKNMFGRLRLVETLQIARIGQGKPQKKGTLISRAYEKFLILT